MDFFKHRWIKITYSIILGLLCTIEIASITRDRREQDRKRDKELKEETKNFHDVLAQEQQHFETTMTHFENLQRTTADLRVLNTHLGPSAIAQPNSLITRGLVLSRGILQWLDAR